MKIYDPFADKFKQEILEFMKSEHPKLWDKFADQISFPTIMSAPIIFNDFILDDYKRFKEIILQLEHNYKNS